MANMKPSQALHQNRQFVLDAAKQFRVTNLRVFGSAARQQDTESSDLDILVDTTSGATLFDLGGLQDELQELLGLRVELLTADDLPASFRAKVLAEAVPL